MAKSSEEMLIERFRSKHRVGDGCWEWVASRDRCGYGRFTVNRREIKAHRFAYKVGFGPIPDGMLVCHKCDNPSCVRHTHLFLGTPAENSADMVFKGRQPVVRGVRHGLSKFTEDEVGQIRAARASGTRHVDIARRYGVCESTIRKIVGRVRWRHV